MKWAARGALLAFLIGMPAYTALMPHGWGCR